MVNKVLLVGINYIGTECELSGCVNDIKNIRTYLRKNFMIDEITILSEEKKAKSLPTRNNIIQELKNLVKNSSSGDNLYFHYSGHGSQVPDYDGSEIDGKDECICPLDYQTEGMITDDELRELLVYSLKKGVNLFCVVDACHSGTILDLKYQYTSHYTESKLRKNLEICRNFLNKLQSKPKVNGSIITISGARDFETAADAYEERENQGAMTFALLKTLKYHPNITHEKLINEMNILLKRKRYAQRPQLCYEPKGALKKRCSLLG